MEAYKKRFFDIINRSRLCTSDAMFMATVHAQELVNKIFDDTDLRGNFLKFKNPRAVFVECFSDKILSCENTAPLGNIKCTEGHRFISLMEKVSLRIFNFGGTNYVNDINSKIHEERKNKRKKTLTKQDANTEATRKILKLQSDRK